MKRIRYEFLKYLFFALPILGCQKDDLGYLENYTGFFAFTIEWHDQFYISNIDTTYIKTFNGEIIKYSGNLNNADRRLSIHFGNTINPEVLKSGQFVDQQDIHEGFSGKFLNADELRFEFWQNSAGFSKKAIINGIRK